MTVDFYKSFLKPSCNSKPLNEKEPESENPVPSVGFPVVFYEKFVFQPSKWHKWQPSKEKKPKSLITGTSQNPKVSGGNISELPAATTRAAIPLIQHQAGLQNEGDNKSGSLKNLREQNVVRNPAPQKPTSSPVSRNTLPDQRADSPFVKTRREKNPSALNPSSAPGLNPSSTTSQPSLPAALTTTPKTPAKLIGVSAGTQTAPHPSSAPGLNPSSAASQPALPGALTTTPKTPAKPTGVSGRTQAALNPSSSASQRALPAVLTTTPLFGPKPLTKAPAKPIKVSGRTQVAPNPSSSASQRVLPAVLTTTPLFDWKPTIRAPAKPTKISDPKR